MKGLQTPDVYIFTSDRTNYILNATSHLFSKYWRAKTHVKVLGFKKPHFSLPKDFEFVSMGKDYGPDKWSRPIYKTMKNIREEFVITMLDDHLPIVRFDEKLFWSVFARMQKDERIVKYGLGYAPSQKPDEYRVIDSTKNYDVIEINQDAPYRLNVQINVWRTKYLLKHLEKPMSAWDFELKEAEMAKKDGVRMIGTRRRYAFRWIERSALSGSWKGKINVLGLGKEDLKLLISKKIFDPKDLQYGQHEGAPFEKYGLNFKITDLEGYYDKKYYHDLIAEYGVFYGLKSRDIPPKYVPEDLKDGFSLKGRIPVRYWYINETLGEKGHYFSKGEINENISKIKQGQASYYGQTDAWLYQALSQFPIAGKEVAVVGSTTPWYESVCLAYGARPVTIEYNKIETDDARLDTRTVDEFRKNPKTFDHAFCISSVEHDGLGRYGDPIDPWGDLRAMDEIRTMIRSGGLLFLAVPVGVDVLYWNAHRLYGSLRLPLLLAGWRILKAYGFDPKLFSTNLSSGIQPVFVLQKV